MTRFYLIPLIILLLVSALCSLAQPLKLELHYDLKRITFHGPLPDTSLYHQIKYRPQETSYHVDEYVHSNGEFSREYQLMVDSFGHNNWPNQPTRVQITSRSLLYCASDECTDYPRDSVKQIPISEILSRHTIEPFDLPLNSSEVGYFKSQGYQVDENSASRVSLNHENGAILIDRHNLTESEYTYKGPDTFYSIRSYQLLPGGVWFNKEMIEGSKEFGRPEKVEIRQYSNVVRKVFEEPEDTKDNTNKVTVIRLGQNRFEFLVPGQKQMDQNLIIVDALGKVVFRAVARNGRLVKTLQLPPGTYFVKTTKSLQSTSFTITP